VRADRQLPDLNPLIFCDIQYIFPGNPFQDITGRRSDKPALPVNEENIGADSFSDLVMMVLQGHLINFVVQDEFGDVVPEAVIPFFHTRVGAYMRINEQFHALFIHAWIGIEIGNEIAKKVRLIAIGSLQADTDVSLPEGIVMYQEHQVFDDFEFSGIFNPRT